MFAMTSGQRSTHSEVQLIICKLNRPHQEELYNNTFIRKIITEVKGVINRTKA